jgi:hypothetical protein
LGYWGLEEFQGYGESPRKPIELSQMVTLSTTESFPIPFSRPTPMLRPLDKLPLMLKRNPMSGEMDSLPTQDQFFPFNKNIPKDGGLMIELRPPNLEVRILQP